MGDVNADPSAVELLSRCNGCAASGKGVKNKVALVAAGLDDALKECKGFLGGVAEALTGCGCDCDVRPNIL